MIWNTDHITAGINRLPDQSKPCTTLTKFQNVDKIKKCKTIPDNTRQRNWDNIHNLDNTENFESTDNLGNTDNFHKIDFYNSDF